MPFFISDTTSDAAQILADGALYFQTSMGPQFLLAAIPTAQVGHKLYDDILIRSGLVTSVTTKEALTTTISSFQDVQQPIAKEFHYQGLGIRMDWAKKLLELYQGSN